MCASDWNTKHRLLASNKALAPVLPSILATAFGVWLQEMGMYIALALAQIFIKTLSSGV